MHFLDRPKTDLENFSLFARCLAKQNKLFGLFYVRLFGMCREMHHMDSRLRYLDSMLELASDFDVDFNDYWLVGDGGLESSGSGNEAFLILPPTQTSLFLLTLFTDFSPYSNVAVALPINHRQVHQGALLAHHPEYPDMPSMYEDAFVDNGDQNYRGSFQSGHMEAFMYKLVKATSRAGCPNLQHHLRSISQVTYLHDVQDAVPVELENATVVVTGVCAKPITERDIRLLHHIMGAPGNQVTGEPKVLKRLLSKIHPDLGVSNEALKNFCKHCLLSFEVDFDMDPAYNNKRFHSYFRSLTRVTASLGEGNHRLELAMRLFYGFIPEQKVPLVLDSNRSQVMPHAKGTATTPIELTVLLAPSGSMIKQSTLDSLKDRSQVTQDIRGLYIAASWQNVLQHIFTALCKKNKKTKKRNLPLQCAPDVAMAYGFEKYC